jgi:ketol-acid reductoisomerase
MTTIYHEDDASVRDVEGQVVAVLGYGNQGRSQALNARDSGLEVVVGNIDDAYREQAEADGFAPVAIAEAARRGDLLLLLVPDEVMPEVYSAEVAPNLEAGNLLDFAHGYNIAFDLIAPPSDVDVVMIAPRMIGAGVRDAYVSGAGYPSFVSVHQDATGNAKKRMLGLAAALGSTRGGCLEMSMNDEATLDLFTEQAFGPAFGRVLMTAIQTLTDAGYPPEAVLMELYLSGEFAYSFEKMRELGMVEQHKLHSHTSQYGSITRSANYFDLGPALLEKMNATLEEIRSGAFAKEWSADREEKLALIDKAREAQMTLPMTQWEDRTRREFRIGNAAPPRR